MSGINGVLHAISDHGNALASKLVTYFGVSAGIGGGTVLGVANGTAQKLVTSQGFGIQDWAAVVAIVSGLCLAIKTVVDTYYSVQDRKERKEAARQETLIALAEDYLEDEKKREAMEHAKKVQETVDKLAKEKHK